MAENHTTESQELPLYHEDWILRKEGLKTWVGYWTVIKGTWMLFYEEDSRTSRANLRKTLQLTAETTCALVSRRKNRFPFSIHNGRGTYYFKCDTELQRYHWIIAVTLSSTDKDIPKSMPASIPLALTEKTIFPVKPLHEPKKERPRTGPPNKRRQKYHDRRQSKLRVKMEKRGQIPPRGNPTSSSGKPTSRQQSARPKSSPADARVTSRSLVDMRQLAVSMPKEDMTTSQSAITIVTPANEGLPRTRSSRRSSDFDISDADIVDLDDVDDPFFTSHNIVQINASDIVFAGDDCTDGPVVQMMSRSRSPGVVNVSPYHENTSSTNFTGGAAATADIVVIKPSVITANRSRPLTRGAYANEGLDNDSINGSVKDLRSRGPSPVPPRRGRSTSPMQGGATRSLSPGGYKIRSVSPAARWNTMNADVPARPSSGSKFSRHLAIPET